ncbi:protein piccolo [Elysia marginata]|uniref:Protein piccolo n=1 Tax=Elysia marginata TaxID=1093978 RepID=A0AAV4FC13_9GAST|nr:protein piccolo [Elysia marginata]
MMHDKRADSGSSSSSSGSTSRTSSSDVSRHGEPSADGKKVRRKLPPIPAGEDPVLAPKSRGRRSKGEGDANKETSGSRRGTTAVPSGARQDGGASTTEVTGARSAALQGFIVGRSNRKMSPRSGDENMNEEDMEVARLTTRTSNGQGQRATSSSVARLSSSDDSSATPARQKGYLAETGKSRSLDSVDSVYSARGGKTDVSNASTGSGDGGRVKPPLKKTASLGGPGPQCETDAMIDELIEIYGIPCTEAMKCLKQRLQEELRRVTRDRKRKLEELEEIRALQMQIGALKLESDALSRTRALVGRQIELDRNVSSSVPRHGRQGGPSPGTSTSSSTPKSSPQVTPRRARHKRQSSDPMVSKFSPIKEDRDIEADLSSWGLHLESIPLHGSRKTPTYPSADESSQSGISDSESTRSEPATRRHNKGKAKPHNRVDDHSNRFLAPDFQAVGGSVETLSQYTTPSRHQVHHHHHQHRHRQDPGAMHLSGSRSEQHLPSSGRRMDVPNYTSHYSSDDDEEHKVREEKRALLQWEITRRRRQLEETARLKEELLKLARSRHGHAQSWDDLSRQELSHQYVAPAQLRPVPRGIITPIEDSGGATVVPVRRSSRDPSRERSRSREASRERAMGIPDEMDHPYESPGRVSSRGKASSASAAQVEDPYSYSSSEYLAHKQEAGRRYTRSRDGPVHYGSQGWIPGVYGRDGPDLGAGQPAYSQPALNNRADSAVSLSGGGGGGGSRREVAAQDVGGIVSSVTLPNIYSNRMERNRDFRQPYRDQTFASTSISDTDNSPASDVTPAMPLLGDVKIKSRAIIRNIGSGSRPVSAEFSAGEVEDLLNAMYRVESDNSVDADEPIMKHMTEGGVTILKQIERKRRVSSLP